MSMFQKAEKRQAKARIAITGPAGSGKTWTALAIARALADGGKVACIDTERGSASLYAGDVADFDVCELPAFSPSEYMSAINAAAEAGYACLVIDSLSHAWSGEGGVLDIVDKAAARSKSGNKFAAWREGTPQQNALVDAILRAPMHVICTMRSKTEYVLEEDERGRKTPRKVGMAPIQRDQIEYEFTVCLDVDLDHRIVVGKTRCAALDRGVFPPAGPTGNAEKVAHVLRAWLASGAAERPQPPRQNGNGVSQAVPAETLALADAQARERGHGSAVDEADAQKRAAVAVCEPWAHALDALVQGATLARKALDEDAENRDAQATLDEADAELGLWLDENAQAYRDVGRTRPGASVRQRIRTRLSKLTALVGRGEAWLSERLGAREDTASGAATATVAGGGAAP